MQVWLFRGSVDRKNGINNIGSKLLGEGAVQLRAERGSSDGKKKFAINRPFDLELIEELYIKLLSAGQSDV